MELLLRLLHARTLVLAALAAAALFAAKIARDEVLRRAELRANATQRGAVVSRDILKDLDARDSLRLRALHRTVVAELAAAKADGFDVRRLREVADGELALDAPETRATAYERLNKLRLAIPRRAAALRPAGTDEETPDETPTPRAEAAR